MFIAQCDICKAIISDPKSGFCLQFKPLHSSVCSYAEYKSLDLCKKCVKKLSKAMKIVEKDLEL